MVIVVDIGCIECGESTAVLGVYDTREEASAAHKEGEYFSVGQHYIEFFDSPERAFTPIADPTP